VQGKRLIVDGIFLSFVQQAYGIQVQRSHMLLLLQLPASSEACALPAAQNATWNGGVPSSPVPNVTDALVGLRNKTWDGAADHTALAATPTWLGCGITLLIACLRMQLHSSPAYQLTLHVPT
jgi:hypothetical protein